MPCGRSRPGTAGKRPEGRRHGRPTVPGIALGILTADCAPVLFADAEAGVIGAAHAGWKGALGGVLEAALAAMEELGAGAAASRAAIGPCISQTNYEVGAEFRARFLRADPAHAPALLRARTGRRIVTSIWRPMSRHGWRRRAWRDRAAFGLHLSAENEFFSFRRTTHRNEPDYGREISAIMLRLRSRGFAPPMTARIS